MYIFFMEKLALLNSIVWLYFTVPILVNSFLFFFITNIGTTNRLVYTCMFMVLIRVSLRWIPRVGLLYPREKYVFLFMFPNSSPKVCCLPFSPMKWKAGGPAHQQSSHRTLGAAFQSYLWKNGISTRIFFLILSKVEYLNLKILLHFFFSITYKKISPFSPGIG